jgi:hypothetical protein
MTMLMFLLKLMRAYLSAARRSRPLVRVPLA